MKMGKIGKKILTHFALLIISMSLSSMLMACDAKSGKFSSGPGEMDSRNAMSPRSQGETSDNFEGEWTGTIGGATGVRLVIKPGGNYATLSYGGNRECTAEGRNQSGDTDKPLFTLTSQTGGVFCDNINSLIVKKTAANAISYSVIFSNKKPSEEGTLNRNP